MNLGPNTQFYLLALALFLVIAVLKWLIKLWDKNRAADVPVEAPLLLSMYTANMTLNKVTDGTLNDMHYSLMITEPVAAKAPVYQNANLDPIYALGNAVVDGARRMANPGQIIMMVDLPANSSVHLVGLGIKKPNLLGSINQLAASNNLGAIELEGDFPDYFKVYGSLGQEIDLLEVMGPDVMAFLVDYCKREDWELFENTLYFAQNEDGKSEDTNDNTTMVEDAQNFIKEVLPTLEGINTALINTN